MSEHYFKICSIKMYSDCVLELLAFDFNFSINIMSFNCD